MKKRALVPAIVLAAALVPAPTSAWGFAGHRYIMGRAIELLPPELKTFFDHYREEIVIRAVDPDLWRNVGWDEDPHHFMNFGARELGDYPFTALPRDYGAAIEKFGMATLRRDGMLPWRTQELFGNLRRTFEAFKRGSQYGPSDLILFSAALGHYIQDAHQPFHATNNYDGQLTGNHGIHARFERDLVEKFRARLSARPPAPRAITNARDFAFDVLLASYQRVDPILKADTEAIAGKDTYDDTYFEKFFTRVKPILEERLAEAISATAGLIIGAWDAAGKPALSLEGARPVEKVKKPGII
jgi:hypothetical protein